MREWRVPWERRRGITVRWFYFRRERVWANMGMTPMAGVEVIDSDAMGPLFLLYVDNTIRRGTRGEIGDFTSRSAHQLEIDAVGLKW